MKNNIKSLRVNRNWTQRDLADKLGVSVPVIIELENGKGSERKSSLYRYALAYVFNVDASDIKM